MLKIENRESAHIKSRVKDLSKVPNVVSYTGLFAAVTPISKVPKNVVTDAYDPILIRDTDSLIANFGDPRIDPETYIDLYTIMQIVEGGTSCYVAKVPSGETGSYRVCLATMETSDWGLTVDSLDTKKYKTDALGDKKAEIVSVYKKTHTTSPIVSDTYQKYTVVTSTPSTDSSKLECTISWGGTDNDELEINIGTALVSGESIVLHIPSNDTRLEMMAYSSLNESISIESYVTQAKPYSLGMYFLNTVVKKGDSTIGSVKIRLNDTIANQTIVNALNATLSSYVTFDLTDKLFKDATPSNAKSDQSIAKCILDEVAPINSLTKVREFIKDNNGIKIPTSVEVSAPVFNVTLDDYKKTIDVLTDRMYPGCMLADLTAKLHHTATCIDKDGSTYTATGTLASNLSFFNELTDTRIVQGSDVKYIRKTFDVPTPEERRTLHYYLKQAAMERKDSIAILSTPLIDNSPIIADNRNWDEVSDEEKNKNSWDTADEAVNHKKWIQAQLECYGGNVILPLNSVCDWVSSNGSYTDLFNYGSTDTTNYEEQSFYLEIYYSWLNLACTKLDNGLTRSVEVAVAPSGPVAGTILSAYRERGTHYPVAGNQMGTLSSRYTIISNPVLKADRDLLISYRINPIYDTGTRGIQIYGNETLNAGYTDLNAAHIARTLVAIRSRVDEYTETLKFSINNSILWDTWKNYVSSQILDPLKSINALASYTVAMGLDTTTPEEIANRTIKGNVSLVFYQSAEIFDLSFVVYSSATANQQEQS